MKYLLSAACLCAFFSVKTANAQASFPVTDYVDVNKIKAAAAVHGDLWWDPVKQEAACEFPKGSGKHANFISALWMSGHDPMAQLRTSAQTYRTVMSTQNMMDYWPGPNNGSGAMTYAESQNWARIWKVNFIDIGNFKALATHTVTNTPKDILEWPAKNNPHAKGNGGALLTVTTDMAPFVDVNSDGSYDATKGDYPDIKGDQMLWWVFNDNGPTHSNTPSQPMNVQVKAKAYAYSRGTMLDNIVYYEYDITNNSGINYADYRCAIWNDADLGYFHDDYIGFDSARRMAIIYNGTTTDGTGQPNAYGTSIPVTGISLLEVPGDMGTSYAPAGSFVYFNNDFSIIGNPDNSEQYSNYMRAMLRNGTHFKNDYAGAGTNSKGYGSGPDVNYVFTGDPSNSAAWSECSSNNPPGDRRFVLAINDYAFNAGSTVKFAFALMVTDPSTQNSCPNASFTDIKKLADTALKYYKNQPVSNLSAGHALLSKTLKIYPNPAQGVLYVDISDGMINETDLAIYDMAGRKMNVPLNILHNKIEVNTGYFPKGVYNVILHTNDKTEANIFVKE